MPSSHLAAAFFAAVLLACPADAAPDSAARPASLMELQAKANRVGTVRVIVEFTAPARSIPEGSTPKAAESATKAAIRAGQADILAAAIGANRAAVLAGRGPATLMDYVPMLAFDAKADDLARLAAYPLVTRIVEDMPEKPHLSDAIRIVRMTGSNGAFSLGADGRGRAVAIIDTGADSDHEFLRGKIISEACYGTRSSSPRRRPLCPGGAASSTAKGSGEDCPVYLPGCGHGTLVAGIAAGRNRSLSTGEPASGVARAAAIVSIKVFTRVDSPIECGGPAPCIVAYRSDQVKGLERVYALRAGVGSRKIDVASLSLGTGPVYPDFCDSDPRAGIIAKLRSAGIATVVSSGNAGSTSGVAAPACISKAITVGATSKRTAQREERIGLYSNQGKQVDLAAPGGELGYPYGSTRDLLTSSFPGGGYFALRGTSLAAPHVVGAIAAIRSRPDCVSKSVDEIELALKTTGPRVLDVRTGTRPVRRLNVVAALAALGCG